MKIKKRNASVFQDRKTALIHGFLINCQSNDSLEALHIKHFYTLFMHPRLNEKVSEGSPRERARVKGQTAAVSSFSNLYFSAARPPFFSPPPPLAATSSSAVNAPLPRQHRPSGGSDSLLTGENSCGVVMCRTGRMSHRRRLPCACASPCGPVSNLISSTARET